MSTKERNEDTMINKKFNYTTIPDKIRKAIRQELKGVSTGYTIIQVCKYSRNPMDNYLWVVLGKGGYIEGYAVWIYNSSTGGLHGGRYDMDYVPALLEYTSRING